MKNFLIITLIIFFLPSLKAQENISIMDEINYSQLEKFIQMAKEYYPQRKILTEEEKKAKNTLTMSNISYLDIFSANYYYRPDEKQAISVENPYLTNGFQFGVTLNLGTYLQKPFLTKSAKSDVKIAQLEKQILDTSLEKEVKNRYYNFVQQSRELKLKTIEAQDINGTFQSITNRFEKGEITIEEYNTARAAVSGIASTKLQTELNFLKAKDDLEEIIGAKLSDVK